MRNIILIITLFLHPINGFLPSSSKNFANINLKVSTTIPGNENVPELAEEEKQKQQWELFTKYYTLSEWRGKWSFYDYLDDVIDTTFGR